MRKVLVTGGSGGIGAAICRAFARGGDTVYFCYKSNADGARRVSEETGAAGFCCDVSDFDAVRALCEKTGGIDVLINNAGIAQQKMFCDITERDWDRMFDVNIKSVFNTCSAYTPYMVRKKSGCVINVSSMWGLSGASCEVHYSASKAAVIGFTQALAKELGLSGVRVNCIAPGVIATPMNSALSAEDMRALAEETPLGRIGAPEDVAAAAVWLASEGASFVTGQTISVDGGFVV